jgi:hypothetical protein
MSESSEMPAPSYVGTDSNMGFAVYKFSDASEKPPPSFVGTDSDRGFAIYKSPSLHTQVVGLLDVEHYKVCFLSASRGDSATHLFASLGLGDMPGALMTSEVGMLDDTVPIEMLGHHHRDIPIIAMCQLQPLQRRLLKSFNVGCWAAVDGSELIDGVCGWAETSSRAIGLFMTGELGLVEPPIQQHRSFRLVSDNRLGPERCTDSMTVLSNDRISNVIAIMAAPVPAEFVKVLDSRGMGVQTSGMLNTVLALEPDVKCKVLKLMPRARGGMKCHQCTTNVLSLHNGLCRVCANASEQEAKRARLPMGDTPPLSSFLRSSGAASSSHRQCAPVEADEPMSAATVPADAVPAEIPAATVPADAVPADAVPAEIPPVKMEVDLFFWFVVFVYFYLI